MEQVIEIPITRRLCVELADRLYWQYDTFTIDRLDTEGAFVTMRNGDITLTLALAEGKAYTTRSIYKGGKYTTERSDFALTADIRAMVHAIARML